jgi:hypothetical protein
MIVLSRYAHMKNILNPSKRKLLLTKSAGFLVSPYLQGKVGVQLAELLEDYGSVGFVRGPIPKLRGAVHPRVLRRFPDLTRVFDFVRQLVL